MNNKHLLVLLILIIVSGCSSTTVSDPNSLATDPPQSLQNSSQPQVSVASSDRAKAIDFTTLYQEINALIAKYSEDQPNTLVGIVIEDLNSSKGLEINSQAEFDAASIGKLPILTLLYQKIAKEIIDPQEIILIDDSNVERYGTGSIQYQSLPKEYTVSELAKLMITVSDNTASSVLATKIRRTDLSAHVQELGMKQTNTKENKTVPYDTLIILRYIYDLYSKGDPHGIKMVDSLSKTVFNSRLTKLLPTQVQVAHKIGTQVGEVHDAGIVLLQDRPYIIVVYTKGFSQVATAEEFIAEVSKITIEFFRSL